MTKDHEAPVSVAELPDAGDPAVLDARCFEPKGAFRATAVGLTFEVKR